MPHNEIPSDMYKEHILELYKNPSNFGTLKNANRKAKEYNTTCGDEITVELLVKNDVIRDVKFNGSGCVISLVSASLLTDKLKGMKIEEVKKLDREDIIKLLNIKVNPARIKCVLLSLEAAKKALR